MSDFTKDYLNSATNIVNKQICLIEEKTGISSKYIYIGLALCLASIFIGYLDKYITCLVGIVIPTICSIRTMETKDYEDIKQWLTYWAVFGVFSFVDLIGSEGLKFIPFYFVIKIIFLIWLFMPNTKGASKIYDNLISKCFNKYKSQIDEFDSKYYSNANKLLGSVEENIPSKNNIARKIVFSNIEK